MGVKRLSPDTQLLPLPFLLPSFLPSFLPFFSPPFSFPLSLFFPFFGRGRVWGVKGGLTCVMSVSHIVRKRVDFSFYRISGLLLVLVPPEITTRTVGPGHTVVVDENGVALTKRSE